MVKLIFLTGTSVHVKSDELKRFLLSMELRILLLVSALTFINPYAGEHAMANLESIARDVIMLGSVFAVYFLMVYVAVKLNVQTLVCAVVAVPAAILASYGGAYLSVQLGAEQLSDGMIRWMCGFNFVALCTIEVFYAVFLLPRLELHRSKRSPKLNQRPRSHEGATNMSVIEDRSDFAPASSLASPVSPDGSLTVLEINLQELHVAGHSIKLAELNYIFSDQHYIVISTSTEPDLFVRARLKDAVSQLPLSLGYSIHRSSWVAWTSMTSVIKEYDRLLVVLADDRRLPVARAKRSEFTEWYNMYRPKPIDRMNS